jgi:hypothetical protein
MEGSTSLITPGPACHGVKKGVLLGTARVRPGNEGTASELCNTESPGILVPLIGNSWDWDWDWDWDCDAGI